MAAVAVTADQTTDLLQKMSLETQNKVSNVPEAVKKPSDKQFGNLYKGTNGHAPPYERSTTPTQLDYMDPSMYYRYFYGAYDGNQQDWEEYLKYFGGDGTEVPAGTFGDNASLMYHHGYGYAPYGSYPAAGSPQQYQYPATYFPTANGALFTPSATAGKQGDNQLVGADQKQKPLSTESVNAGSLKVNNGSVPAKSTVSNPSLYAKGSLGLGYQDPRFGYDTSRLPIWSNGSLNSSGVTSSVANGNTASRNQNMRPQNHLLSRPLSGTGAANGFMSQMSTNPIRSGYEYMPGGYDSRLNGRGSLSLDARYRSRGRGNGPYGYGNENADGLNELNRGPRAKVRNLKSSDDKDQKLHASDETSAEKENSSGSPVQEHYNLADFPVDYTDAKFFIIKSYSEDNVHKSIKYNVWASTPNGNKKLDSAYQQAQEKSASCPVFLFFSVNASGQFVGLAEMVSSVDFDKTLEYWQQDKWNGCFNLKWHIVKDVPNTLLKHIILENNENKPVTNSRDTQEVKLEHGLQMLRIFKDHSSRTSLLDDFVFYEARQKAIQEKKVRQKQIWGGKPLDLKSQEGTKVEHELPNSLDALSKLTEEPILSNGEAKISENRNIEKAGDVVTQGAIPVV